MAQLQILDKIERSCKQYGLTIASRTGTTLVVDNGSNDITVSLVDATIGSPMGGINPATSPFLGIGVANPGQIKAKSAISTADTLADFFDTAVPVTLFHILSGFCNDLVLENSDASWTQTVRDNADLIGVGQ